MFRSQILWSRETIIIYSNNRNTKNCAKIVTFLENIPINVCFLLYLNTYIVYGYYKCLIRSVRESTTDVRI